MKSTKTILKYAKISPQKARLVANMIRGQSVLAAERTLYGLQYKKSARLIAAVLQTAKADAVENKKVDSPEDMRVMEIRVDGGPVYKRFMPRARGRATPIRKRTSHITMIIEGQE